MKTSSVIIITVLLVIVVSLVCIWFTPSVQDFMTSNALWNGVSDFRDDTAATDIDSLDALPTLPQGNTLVSIPYVPYSGEELSQIKGFVTHGGTLLLMNDYGYGNQILEYLGVDVRFTNISLLDPLFCYKNPWLPRITDFSPEVSQSGVEVVVLNHATSLTGVADSEVLAWSSSSSFLDYDENGEHSPDEAEGPFPVAARFKLGKGTIALVSDPSIMINSMMGRDDNDALVKYLIAYGGTEPGEILIDRVHLGKSPLDKSQIGWLHTREILSTPYPLLGLVAIIFAVVSLYLLRKEELLG